ncbi:MULTISPECIES: alpha/beta hydrolase [Mycobacteriaceae]|uniref:alpha/beta hydrolase n=1 Tax=Mycobacteriaceae TaxID=1762 RepID=UPI0007FD4B6F|nr:MULTISPECIES: alpha/beta hydrolase [Mycobacteriaceae]MCK0176981.1 alpha/beta hydrolase [Mycolicibacterium sp. F2034L]OBB62137.1 alpha/beta hydrolase [Mycobacterium sp. 852013-51886_SCH5428379]
MTPHEITFDSDGSRCSAWHFPGAGEEGRVDGPAGRPVVVMGHGFGGTKDSGLAPFAERLSAAGLDVFAFDYRGFGASEGSPRQSVSIPRQMADYHAAITEAQLLPGVDRNRVVLWGSSFSGSHVIRVGAERDDVAAVVAMTPMTSGLAVSRAAIEHRDVASALKWTALGVKSRIRVARGKDPVFFPLAARPGEPGALALDGAYDSYTAMAGPTWRNEVDSSVGMQVLSVRTTAAAKRLRAKLLVQIADFDRYVPAASVQKTAVHGRAIVHHYPCDHFDVWPGHDWFEPVAEDQVAFLTRTLRVMSTT